MCLDICPRTLSVSESGQFSESVTLSYEEQIMSKGKYTSIFSPQMEAIVFIIVFVSFLKYRFVLHYANEESVDVVGDSN